MESVPVKDPKTETLPARTRLTAQQKRSFLAAWAGWAMDGMFLADGYHGTRVAKFDKDGKFLLDWGQKGTPPAEGHASK